MSECQHCSQTQEQHLESAATNIADYLILKKLAEQTPGVEEILNRVLQEWRTHALPECDPLAIS